MTEKIPHYKRSPRLLPRMTDEWAIAIIVEAARVRKVRPAEIMRKNQKRGPSHARFGVIWAMKEAGYAYVDIAATLGMGDHTTALYGWQVATRLRDEDPDYRAFTDELLAYALTKRPRTDAEAA